MGGGMFYQEEEDGGGGETVIKLSYNPQKTKNLIITLVN